jgi:hypothetical protein
MPSLEIQSPDLNCISLVLNSSDATGAPVAKTFTLAYDYRALKRIEDNLHVDLKSYTQWIEVKSWMTPQLVHAGLAKFHPEVTLEEIQDSLNPIAQGKIQDAIFELLFPGVLKKLEELKAKQDEALPNEQAETTVA